MTAAARWLLYAIAGAALVAAGAALARKRGRRTRPGAKTVEDTMQEEAMARAHSEVSSGEYDMQG